MVCSGGERAVDSAALIRAEDSPLSVMLMLMSALAPNPFL